MIQAADDRGPSLVERMLDEHGLAYICRNPSVLFDGYTDTSQNLANAVYRRRPLGCDTGAGPGYGARDPESPAGRAREAYIILAELYAPWPAEPAEPRGSPYEGSRYLT
jgi:hypothetical protein